MTIIQKRVAGVMEGEFVVFLIGMRINRWWLPHKWLRVGSAMGKMLTELNQKPELGFLAGESWFGRTTILVSYWRSMAHLMEYARNREAEHLPEWRKFNKLIGTNGDVGIWHETYRVAPSSYESVYVNMAPFGLGKAGQLVEATGKRERAEGRLGRHDVPALPVE
jgi:hypothetical protein